MFLQFGGLGGLILAAASDLRDRIIPNRLVLWVLAAGLGSRIASVGWGSWLSLVVGIAVFAPLSLLARREVIGGGDAKMITAATFLAAPRETPALLLAIALAGGALALAALAAASLRRVWQRSMRAEGGFAAHSAADWDLAMSSMPFGLAILAGSAVVLMREAH